MTDILYKDTDVVVCLKRPGELSQEGKGGERSLVSTLREQLGCEIYPVHRLDRETGGIMVYACSKRGAAALSAAIQAHRLEKEYVCVVRGEPAEESGAYIDLLLHDKQRNKSFIVTRMRGGVKEARLTYRVLGKTAEHTLVRVALQTGRTHQIRVQFAGRKTPLVGDGKYGGGHGELALWSFRLSFPHPVSGERLTFARMPEGGVWAAFDIPRE